jgi:hypothetical protein
MEHDLFFIKTNYFQKKIYFNDCRMNCNKRIIRINWGISQYYAAGILHEYKILKNIDKNSNKYRVYNIGKHYAD